MTNRDDLARALLSVPGVGHKTADAVLDALGTDLATLQAASESDFAKIPGVGTATAKALRASVADIVAGGFHTPVEDLRYRDTRKNIPTDQLSQLVDTNQDGEPDLALYPRNPELDPQLVWKGKDDLDSVDLAVPVVPIYIQDKVVPHAIIENLRETAAEGEDEPELSLFEDFDGVPAEGVFDFYQYDANWSNRMILGDALVAMTSLAEKENLKAKVQTIYIDPPYGIKFQSNWQVSTRDRSVADGKDITRQPEQVRAFRDTWKNGIHSYLTYLRDRLQVAHTLLNPTGSIFVQIGDDNLHTARSLLDEVFGPENFVSVITFQKVANTGSGRLDSVCDYLLWYARDVELMKYRELYLSRPSDGYPDAYYKAMTPEGEATLSKLQRAGFEPIPPEWRVFRLAPLTSSRPARGGDLVEYEYEGHVYTPGGGTWKTNKQGMDRLAAAGRLSGNGSTLSYVRHWDDFGVSTLNNVWTDTKSGSGMGKVYVVQTNELVVERCLLMTSDPGDLVLDPTCGSGTTASVAEKWGRRWITVDTSRVALALARARIMGGQYPYWLLADTAEGAEAEAHELGRVPVRPEGGYGGDVRKGFVYRRAPHIMLSTIANCEEIEPGMTREDADAAIRRSAESEVLIDQPVEDKKKVRVAGPFTVESLSPHRTLDPTLSVSPGDMAEGAESVGKVSTAPNAIQDFATTVVENLRRSGVQNGYRNERLVFDSLDAYAGGGWVAAVGNFTDGDGEERLVAISIGPEHGTVGREQVNGAAREAVRLGADIVLVCGFAFDGGATDEASDASSRDFPVVGEQRVGRVRVLNVRVNADLLMDEELKSTGSGNLFMVFGEPDIAVEEAGDGQVAVTLRGVDVYDPVNNEVRSSGPEDAMAWFIDTDYDENQFFVRHAYFTGNTAKYDPYSQLKRALNSEIDHEAWGRLHATTSMAFPRPSSGKIAVKVINHYGDEVLKVFDLSRALAPANQ